MAADKKLSQLDAAQALAIADELVMTDDPAGTPVSQRATVQQLAETLDILTASGVLAVSDVVPVLNGGTVKKATLQKILDAVDLLAVSAFPDGDEYIPVYQSGAKRTQVSDLTEYWNTAIPSKVGWIEKWATPDGDTSATTIGEVFTAGGGGTFPAVTNGTGNPSGISAVTSTTLNNRAYFGGNAIHWLRKEIRLQMWIRLPATTSITCQFGLYETSYGSITNVDTIGGATDWVGFRYSTATSDPAIMYTYGTAGAGSFVTTGVLNTNVNLFDIRLKPNGRVDYFVNNTRVGNNVNVTTDVSTNLQIIAGVTTLSGGSTKQIDWFGHRISQKWF